MKKILLYALSLSMIISKDSSELRIYTTTTKTNYKIKSLMYDRVYRMGVAAEQTCYNQPPHIGFYLSEDCFYGKMTGIELNTSNAKTKYYLGEELDTSGLAVIGKYSNAADKTFLHTVYQAIIRFRSENRQLK